MIAVPFVYFLLLAWHFYRAEKQFGLAVFIALLYAFSSGLSVLMVILGMRVGLSDITILPTFFYCFLITVCLLPIHKWYRYFSRGIQPINSTKVLKVMAWISLLYFIFYAIMSYGEMVNVLTGDMGQIRNDMYNGIKQESWMSRMNPIVRIPASLLNMILGASWIMQFLFFFCIFVQKMPRKYGYMMLAGSLTGTIGSIVNVDRSGITYWILGLVGCYIFFRPYIGQKGRKASLIIGTVLVGVFFLYLMAVTDSRFGDRDNVGDLTGGQASAVGYLAQPFPMFCYMFNNFERPFLYPGVLFPFMFEMLIPGGLGGIVEWQRMVSWRTGHEIGVFYTFLGTIMLGMGKIVMVVYSFLIGWGANALLRRNKLQVANLTKSFIYILFATVTMLGLFGHYYAIATRTFSIVFFLIVFSLISRGKKINNNKKSI